MSAGRGRGPRRWIAFVLALLVVGLFGYGVPAGAADENDQLRASMGTDTVPLTVVAAITPSLEDRVRARAEALDQTAAETASTAALLADQFYSPATGRLTSPWGMRIHPVLGVERMHEGQDIGARCDTPVSAALAGTVVAVGEAGDAGNRVLIDHGVVKGHHLVTGYLHMNGFSVTLNQSVQRGQQIGVVGSTGMSTGCHLHLAVWSDDVNVDPAPFLKAR